MLRGYERLAPSSRSEDYGLAGVLGSVGLAFAAMALNETMWMARTDEDGQRLWSKLSTAGMIAEAAFITSAVVAAGFSFAVAASFPAFSFGATEEPLYPPSPVRPVRPVRPVPQFLHLGFPPIARATSW